MNTKKMVLSGVMIGMVIIVGMAVVATRKVGRAVKSEQGGQVVALSPPLVSAFPSLTRIPASEMQTEIQSPQADAPSVGKQQKVAAPATRPPKSKEPIQDPIARAALSFVGADAIAEEYWIAAINDPNLPANERKDLIEDLNEDGLSDPKRPGPQDLPLIWSRLRLIEMIAPYAMDQVNVNALAEAYKDLVNLADGRLAP